jgi:hypothetical protein
LDFARRAGRRHDRRGSSRTGRPRTSVSPRPIAPRLAGEGPAPSGPTSPRLVCGSGTVLGAHARADGRRVTAWPESPLQTRACRVAEAARASLDVPG